MPPSKSFQSLTFTQAEWKTSGNFQSLNQLLCPLCLKFVGSLSNPQMQNLDFKLMLINPLWTHQMQSLFPISLANPLNSHQTRILDFFMRLNQFVYLLSNFDSGSNFGQILDNWKHFLAILNFKQYNLLSDYSSVNLPTSSFPYLYPHPMAHSSLPYRRAPTALWQDSFPRSNFHSIWGSFHLNSLR